MDDADDAERGKHGRFVEPERKMPGNDQREFVESMRDAGIRPMHASCFLEAVLMMKVPLRRISGCNMVFDRRGIDPKNVFMIDFRQRGIHPKTQTVDAWQLWSEFNEALQFTGRLLRCTLDAEMGGFNDDEVTLKARVREGWGLDGVPDVLG